jgi:hypothetical protein
MIGKGRNKTILLITTLFLLITFASNICGAVSNQGSSTVTIKRSDFNGPVIDIISLSGGYGIHAILKNCLNMNVTNVNWSITVTGGIFHRINIERHGTIACMTPGQDVPIATGVFFGWGTVHITVDVINYNFKSVDGMQQLFYSDV